MKATLLIRELAGPLEFLETMEVSQDAWDFPARMLPPAADLVAATHAGGLTAAAFEGKRMLAFVHGIPRVNMGEPCQHSHLLAVRREAQGRGLSTRLKLFQRQWCLDQGIRLVTWTYDPFLVKNAKLNLVKLRATVRSLLPNFYGEMGGIYGHLPSDRFEVQWRLDAPEVEAAAKGETPAPDVEGVPLYRPRSANVDGRLLLPFLAGAPSVYRSDPSGSTRARHVFARAAQALFEKGFQAVSVAEHDGKPCYLFERC